MTSTAPSSTPAPTTNQTAPITTAASRPPTASGQAPTTAAVTANTPAPRQASLSYANVVTSKNTPTGPGAAASTTATQGPAATPSGQHARSASTASVNGGRVQPAVPTGTGGKNVANGNSTPYSGGQHSRRSSLATGAMPNGSRPVNINFGAINEPGSGAQPSGTAAAAGTSLTAPVANPSAASPQPSPSPAPASVASGGAPPQAGRAGGIQFGDATQQQARPTSMPPAGPGSMAPQGHGRRDSTHSAHGDNGTSGPHPARGVPPANRGNRHQSYGPGQFQQQQNYYRNYPQGNQTRNGPPNMGGAPPFNPQQQVPGSPHRFHRSPAMTHASPSMAPVVPTQQLYPPTAQAPQQFVPGSPHFIPQMGYDQGYYQAPQYQMGYAPQYAQTSPRPQFSQVQQPVGPGGYMQGYPPTAVSMSRSSSSNVPDMHRPASGMGHHPAPSMAPQPQNIIVPPQPGTPGPPPSPYGRPKRAASKALVIKDPTSGNPVEIKKSTPTPATSSTPPIVSSPSPGPGRSTGRDAVHSRSGSTSKGKTEAEKRQEMRDTVMRQVELRKAEEIAEKKRQEEAAKDDEARKLKETEEADAKKKEEEEEAEMKAAEEAAIAEAEEEERVEKERAKVKAEAKLAKDNADKEASRLEDERLRALEAEADRLEIEREERAAAREKAEQEEKAKAAAEVSAAEPKETETPVASKVSTPDREAMPPPSLRAAPKAGKPQPLKLTPINTEPGPPSAALTALRSARPVDNLKHLLYPEGIQSPNPALNPLANTFKYDKEFLMQFQGVFTDKPSVDWDQKMKDTVGDSESGRSTSARTPAAMGPRTGSRSGPGSMPGMMMGGMGAMGSMGSIGGGMGTFASRPFAKAPAGSSANPLAGVMTSMSRQNSSFGRSNSNTSMSGQSGQIPQSPRTGNRSSRGGGSRRGGGSAMDRNDSRHEQRGGPTIPIEDVVPLAPSDKRWKPISVGKKPSAPEPSPAAAPDNRMAPEMVQRKVKAALNKMTPEKFEKISDQILEITAQSKFESDGRTLRQVIQLTFEKATDEAHWASMYAKFCKRMLETMDPNIKDEGIKDKNGAVVTGGNLFRKYLLNRCQEEFEQGWKANLPPKPEGEPVNEEAAMLSDEYYIEAAAKRRGLGLVQFIGELFKLGMLTERIMNECVRKLLDFEGVPEDETCESLTKLLRTIGAQLDSSERSRPMMDAYFQRIQKMMEHKDLNSRMKFMLMDIIDLRTKRWESKENNKGPKTIQEIREEALKAQQEKEAANRASRGNRPQGGRGDARSFSQQGYGGGMHGPGGFHDNRAGGTVAADDLRKLKSTGASRQVSTGAQFGPTSMFSGPRGSSGGSRRGLGPNSNRDDSGPNSRTATPPAPASTSSPNPFSALEASMHAPDNDAVSPPPSNTGSPQVSNAKPETN